jgi:perosamine synthetase
VKTKKEIPVALPSLGEEEARAVQETVLSGWVTQGPKVKEFEEAFARYVGAQYACAVSSCTAALNLALLAVGVKPGDVVITVSHSFIATANAVRHCQAEPVFVDIDPDTFNMDPSQLAQCLAGDFDVKGTELWYRDTERLMTEESPLRGRRQPIGRLGAILVVHQVGMPADLKQIIEIGKRYGIPVVEDAACAIGSEISLDEAVTWTKIGRPHGDVACFSFHPRKVITTGDGGMLTTSNSEYDRIFRLLRQHGMGLSDLARHSSDRVIFENYLITGYNYRMTDIQAAVGVEQLKRLRTIVDRRRALASIYSERLNGIKNLRLPLEPSYAKTNWQSYVVRFDKKFRQKELMQSLKEEGIATRRGVMCAHLEPPYAKAWPKGSLPNSEEAQQRAVVLPLYPSMDSEAAEFIANVLSTLCK